MSKKLFVIIEVKDLPDKYYNGETSLEEENELKLNIISNKNSSSEKDIFRYFQEESFVPNDLEKTIFSKLEDRQHRKKTIRMRLYSFTSAAAVIIIFLSIYLDFRNAKNTKLENDFFIMEQALFLVSENIQPKEQEEMLVLWVDDNVEIIIN